MKSRGLIVASFVLGAMLLLAVPAYLLPEFANSDKSEIAMALVIVIALATLMILLFIVSSSFSFLGLSDSKQALGLPEGSIRAVIALVLILIFIIFGLYLFRLVSTGFYSQALNGLTTEELSKLKGRMLFISPSKTPADHWDVQVDSSVS
jgi:hypothetical protein